MRVDRVLERNQKKHSGTGVSPVKNHGQARPERSERHAHATRRERAERSPTIGTRTLGAPRRPPYKQGGGKPSPYGRTGTAIVEGSFIHVALAERKPILRCGVSGGSINCRIASNRAVMPLS